MSNGQDPRRRQSKNVFTTKSGNSIRLNRSFTEKRRARKDAQARRRAAYLSTLPKNRFKRILYRLHPKRVAKYWFSREGGIMALKVLGIGIVVCFLLLVGLFSYFRKDLPNINDVNGNNQPGSISYYDRTGNMLLFQDYDAEKRTPVPSANISTYMKDATVAIEDKDFYHEGAFNIRGITRAASHDVFGGGGGIQGGSTITQQLVKLNENWTADRTIGRKIKEVILAVELEREYSKDDILTAYVNAAPYGNIENGAEAAAQDYFHESAKDLTLPQAAMLASIPQDPPYYSPYSDPKYNPSASVDNFDASALISRQQYVLDQMAKQGMITQDQADAAKKVDVLSEIQPLQSKYQNIKAPYFVLAAKQQLEAKFGVQTVQRGGWKVTTTLDMGLQADAEKDVQSNLSNVESYLGDEEAMAGEDVQTGQMVMLVGGVDFNDPNHGQINYAQINISPGSSVKPYDYATLINDSKDVGAGSVMYDTQSPIPGYPCTNKAKPLQGGNCVEDYDFRYPGPETLRYALAGSRNVPAIKAMYALGEGNNGGDGATKVINTADSMIGDSNAYKCYDPNKVSNVNDPAQATKANQTQCYLSSAIGDGAYIHLDEHVNGLSTLARLGQYIPQTYILKITDATNKPVYQWTQPKPTQVITQDAAYIVDNMLSDPRASYLPNSGGACSTTNCPAFDGGSNYKFQRYNGWDIAVKTGTTNDNFDGLMTAWTTQYAVASWVGYHTRTKAMIADGMEYMTEPLTRAWIQAALDSTHKTPVNWKAPSDIKTEPAYIVTSHVGLGSIEPSSSTDIYPSWYQPPTSGNVAATVDKVSKKLATSCTPPLARTVITSSNASAFSVDPIVNGGSGSGAYNTNANDDVHNCSDQRPIISLVIARENEGSDNSDGAGSTTCDQSGCTITVTVTAGTHPLTSSSFPGTVALTIDGKVVQTFSMNGTQSPQTFTYNYVPTSSGSVDVSATVTDSVLYQSTTNQSLLNQVNGNNGNGNSNGGGQNGQPNQ